MAHEGQQITNPRTGQRMTFLELRAELLRIDSLNPPTPEREPVHVHPKQESGAEVVSGSLVFEVAGERHHLAAGATISVPANTPHRFWNEGSEDARSIQFFRPALDIASFFETLFALAQQRKLDEKGMPPPLQLAAMVRQFGDEIRPVSPPWPLLRMLSAVLAPIARLRGYRATRSLRNARLGPPFESAARKRTPDGVASRAEPPVRAGPRDTGSSSTWTASRASAPNTASSTHYSAEPPLSHSRWTHERRSPMGTPTTLSIPIRAKPKWLLAIVAAAALVAVIASALLTVDFGGNEKPTPPLAHKSADVRAISALTPAQLAAAFGTGTYSTSPLWASGLTAKERRSVEAIASLTREQQAAAFGNGR